MFYLCTTTSCCYDVTSNKFNLRIKSLNKRVLEQNDDEPVEKFRCLSYEKVICTSTNKLLAHINHVVYFFEKIKKGLSRFYPKNIGATDGIHTHSPLSQFN